MKPLLVLIALFFSVFSFSQAGKITVRKNSTNIVGKTMQLNDLRGAKAGSIKFTSKNNATVKLKIQLKNPIVATNFSHLIPKSQTLNCSYSIINDSLLELTHENYTDTCYYKYINESTNVVQLKNTLHGVIPEDDFSICYHFDSILYSQNYNKSLSDATFNQNIEFDSIYKNIADVKLKKQLEDKLRKEIEEYSNNINYDYYQGKYTIKNNKLNLLENKMNFGNVYLTKKDSTYKIKSTILLSGFKPLTSIYTHNNYGNLIINYGEGIIQYFSPITERYGNKTERNIVKTDTFSIKYVNEYSLLLFNKTDTLNLWQNNNFINARIKNSLGGFYQTYYKALNGNKMPYKKLLFTAKEAIEVNKNYTIKPNSKWQYKLTDSALYLYNNSDTLIDELSNSWESFSFTYHNNEPFIFGSYHYKTSKNKHEFIILFNNNTGVKFTRDEFSYKEAREILKTANYLTLNSSDYKKFNFSASKDFLWLNYKDGKYQKLSFFNHNKAIREQTKEQINNYYLIE